MITLKAIAAYCAANPIPSVHLSEPYMVLELPTHSVCTVLSRLTKLVDSSGCVTAAETESWEADWLTSTQQSMLGESDNAGKSVW